MRRMVPIQALETTVAAWIALVKQNNKANFQIIKEDRVF